MSFSASMLLRAFLVLAFAGAFLNGNASAQSDTQSEMVKAAEQKFNTVLNEKGAGHTDTIAARDGMVQALAQSGNLQQALKIAEENFALAQANIDPKQNHQLPSQVNGMLVKLYLALQQLEKAVTTSKDLLKWGSSKAGADHLSTAFFKTNLAGTLAAVGKKKEAIEVSESAVGKLESKLPQGDLAVIIVQNSLFQWHRELGQHEQALTYGTRCLETLLRDKEGNLGLALQLADGIGQSSTALKQPAQAIPLMEKTLEQLIARVGQESVRVAGLMGSVAKVYYDAGDKSSAIKWMKKAVAVFDARLGPSDDASIANKSMLSMYYKVNGQLKEAIVTAEELSETFSDTFGSTHPTTLDLLEGIATLSEKVGDTNKSEQLKKQVQAARQQASSRLASALKKFEEEKKSSQPNRILRSTPELIMAYTNTGKNDEAIQLGANYQKLSIQQLGLSNLESLKANSVLVAALFSAGQNQQAINQRVQYVEQLKKNLDESNPIVAIANLSLAKSLWRVGQKRDAVSLSETSLKNLKTSKEELHEILRLKGGIQLAGWYVEAGAIEQALALYETFVPGMIKFAGDETPDAINARVRMGICLMRLNRAKEAVQPLQAAHDSLVKSAATGKKLFSDVQQLLTEAKQAASK